jgi:hypothetical protein
MTWKRKDCNGSLVLEDNTDRKAINIRFNIECKLDGVIDIQVQPIQWSEKTDRLHKAFYNSGAYPPRFLLSGTTPDGVNLSSDRVYMVGSGFHAQKDEPTAWQLTIECTELLASSSDFDNGLVYGNQRLMRYDIHGFRSFRTIRGRAPVGEIKAVGAAKIEDYDRITGYLAFKSERSSSVKEWIERVEQHVDLILDVFSLASGRYLEWARRSLWLENRWIETLFRRPARRGKPNLPIFHYLNMQPILDIAISNYTKEIKHETGFGIALEQFLISSLYIESQFATTFMALEHFVNTHARQSGEQTIVNGAEFNAFVLPEIKKALKQAKENLKKDRQSVGVNLIDLDKAFKEMSAKIRELNRYTFVRNMRKFLQKIDVPLDGLSKDEIEKVVQTRHTLIHSGSVSPGYADTEKNQQGLLLLRELLTRIFLTLLKYEGQYSSYLHGHQYIQFPPAKG